MSGFAQRRRMANGNDRENRFRNETKETLVKCLFCQQMLPKAYEEIQAHVDAFHKEKKVADAGGGAASKTMKIENGAGQSGEKTTKKQKRRRVPSADDAENEVDGALRTAQPPNRYFCQICSRGFNYPHRLVGHLELVHKRFDVGDEKHNCEICQREFKFARLVENHLHSHHSGVLYSCLACSTSFSVAQHLDTHMAKKHEGLSYSCKLCSKLFFNAYDLQTHVDVSHQFEANDSFLFCRKCGRNFAFISALEKHEQTHNATAKNDNMQMTICLPSLPKGFLLSMNDKGGGLTTTAKKVTTVKRSASPSVSSSSSSKKTSSSSSSSLPLSRSTVESSLNTAQSSQSSDFKAGVIPVASFSSSQLLSSTSQLSSTLPQIDTMTSTLMSSSLQSFDPDLSRPTSTLIPPIASFPTAIVLPAFSSSSCSTASSISSSSPHCRDIEPSSLNQTSSLPSPPTGSSVHDSSLVKMGETSTVTTTAMKIPNVIDSSNVTIDTPNVTFDVSTTDVPTSFAAAFPENGVTSTEF